jgi:heptosyltransferase-2
MELAGGDCRLIPRSTILQAAGIIERCSLMVTNDTGPKHMAQALGVATVCIYGPTWKECWGPGGAENIEIQKAVECGPCDKTECEDLRCMTRVEPEEVIEAARALIKRSPGDG